MNKIITFVQIVFINLIFLLAEWLVHLLKLTKLPGSILGLILLFLLLNFNIIKLEWVERGAKWLLAELLLFFIPPTVGIVQYPQIFGPEGIRIIIVVWISLFAVMCGTGWIAETLHKRKIRKGEEK
jgi:holin-like protein